MSEKKFIIYTDGGARGNPGPAGIGVVIYDEQKQVIDKLSEYLGVATNNQAEYKAVVAAFKKAKELGATELDFYLDSELVVKQLKREYKVKNKDLAPLFLEIHNLSLSFKKISYTHIPRELNKVADALANEAMDRG
jgi:ribonuclease HI